MGSNYGVLLLREELFVREVEKYGDVFMVSKIVDFSE